jgi:hypothetical protein
VVKFAEGELMKAILPETTANYAMRFLRTGKILTIPLVIKDDPFH